MFNNLFYLRNTTMGEKMPKTLLALNDLRKKNFDRPTEWNS